MNKEFIDFALASLSLSIDIFIILISIGSKIYL